MIDFSRFIGFPCAFIIALFAWLVKRFFEVFRKFLDCRFSPFQEPLSLNFCTYYIMPCGVCQEVFLIFFKIFLEPFGVPLLTSLTLYHHKRRKSRTFFQKVAQFREILSMIFCAVCRLTFCWRWCIMKIRPAACASGPLNLRGHCAF